MTLLAEPPPAEAADGGVIEEARKRQRRHATAACAATALIVAAVTAAIVWSSGGGNANSPSRQPVASPNHSASTIHRSHPARVATTTTEARAQRAAVETRYFMVIPHSSPPAT
jgi:hypothetical protein